MSENITIEQNFTNFIIDGHTFYKIEHNDEVIADQKLLTICEYFVTSFYGDVVADYQEKVNELIGYAIRLGRKSNQRLFLELSKYTYGME